MLKLEAGGSVKSLDPTLGAGAAPVRVEVEAGAGLGNILALSWT